MNVIDPRTRVLLQQTFRRESLSHAALHWRSLSRGRSPPAMARCSGWPRSPPKTAAPTEAFGRFLFRRRIPPSFSGAYPSRFTTMNFLSLEYLLPRLVDASVKPSPTWRATWRP